jgi:hypothetical protein
LYRISRPKEGDLQAAYDEAKNGTEALYGAKLAASNLLDDGLEAV